MLKLKLLYLLVYPDKLVIYFERRGLKRVRERENFIKFNLKIQKKSNTMPQQRADFVRLGQYKCTEKTKHLLIKKNI